MTIYEVFLQFWTALFPVSFVTTYEPIFIILSFITTLAFLRYLANLVQKIIGVFVK
jgi:hypothetical protein